MYNGQKIRDLLREKKVSNKQLIEYMGWRGNGQLAHVATTGTSNPTAKVLEKIADFFQVPIDTFFDRNITVKVPVPGSSGKSLIENLQHEIDNLHLLLDEKNKRLELQQRLLDVYEKNAEQS